MTDKAITNISNPTINIDNSKTAPWLNTSPNATLDNLISKSNCGTINGKPSIAINAAFCCALAAIADSKVKTKLKLIPPKHTIPKKASVLFNGFFNKRKNNPRLSTLINNIKIILYSNLAMMNSLAPTIE